METSIIHKISAVKFEGDLLIVHSGNQTYTWALAQISSKLPYASESERNDFSISPSGYGIHWHQLDEDLSLNGLLKFKS